MSSFTKRGGLLGALLLAVVGLLSGCNPEFSTTEGVSIKKARHNYWAKPRLDNNGDWFTEGNSIADILHRKFPDKRIISSVDISGGYDLTVSARNFDEAMSIQVRAIENTFALSILEETRVMPVQILVRSQSVPLRLRSAQSDAKPRHEIIPPIVYKCGSPLLIPDIAVWLVESVLRPKASSNEPRREVYTNYSTSLIAYLLERGATGKIVVDETNLEGEYDFEVNCEREAFLTLEEAINHVGLKLKDAQRPVRAVYVDEDTDREALASLKPMRNKPQLYPVRPAMP